jgi:D-sedoheptulose 7-phosphate isomerase
MTSSISTTAYYASYLKNLNAALAGTVVTDRKANALPQEEGIRAWCRLCHGARLDERTMYFVGNGASATMASHMAADFSKNCSCRAMAFNDIAMMTAVSNDIHYADCFAVPLSRFASPGDLLITVSSSGNSPNIIRAIEKALAIGMRIVTVSGMKPDNRSRRMGDLNFWVPADTYGLVEASHQVLLHCWLDTFLELYEESLNG